MQRLALVLVSFLALTDVSAVSAAERLFEPLQSPQLEKVAAYNARQLAEDLYFASRHRIVRVSVEPLLREENVLFNLFEDTAYEFEVIEVERRSEPILWFWRGVPVEQAESVRNQRPAEFAATGAYSTVEGTLARVAQEFAINTYAVDRRSGRAVTPGEVASRGLIQNGAAPSDSPPEWDVHAFRSLRGELRSPSPSRARFRIIPLRLSPRYHLVIEIDPERSFGPPEYDWDMSIPAQIAREHNDAYNEYLKGLPEQAERPTLGEIP